MIRLVAVLVVLLVGFVSPIVAEQDNEKSTQPHNGVFTGIHRNRGMRGRPETATITDGKSYIVLTEQEYRTGGYWPPFQKLPMIIVRRLPVLSPVPNEEELPRR